MKVEVRRQKVEGRRLTRRTPEAPAFLNVDLEIESARKLDVLVAAWGERVVVLYHGPGRLEPGPSSRSRRRLLTLEAGRQYRTPDAAIHALCALVEALPPAARRVWDGAAKRFDVGCQLRTSEPWIHFALKFDTLERLTGLGASVAVSVYREDLPEA